MGGCGPELLRPLAVAPMVAVARGLDRCARNLLLGIRLIGPFSARKACQQEPGVGGSRSRGRMSTVYTLFPSMPHGFLEVPSQTSRSSADSPHCTRFPRWSHNQASVFADIGVYWFAVCYSGSQENATARLAVIMTNASPPINAHTHRIWKSMLLDWLC